MSVFFSHFLWLSVGRLGPNVGDGGCILPNASFPIQPNSTSSLPQAVPQMINQEPIMQQPFPSLQQSTSELSQMSLQHMRTSQTSSQSSQLAVSEVQRQSHQTDKVEQQLSLQVTSQQVLQWYWLFSNLYGLTYLLVTEEIGVIGSIGTHSEVMSWASSHSIIDKDTHESPHGVNLRIL